MKLRTGASVGRTIYVQRGDAPSKKDAIVGMVDTDIMAAALVEAFNEKAERAIEEMVSVPQVPANGSDVDVAIMQITHELLAQDAKWGTQNHADGTGQLGDDVRADMAREREKAAAASLDGTTWRLILEEEVNEAFAETDPDLLDQELTQVAAVVIHWKAALARRRAELEEEARTEA